MGDKSNPEAEKASLPVRSSQNDPSHLSAGSHLDSHSGLLTPSMLTPNTRAEAEFAFTSNATQQTDSAAPSRAPPDTGSPVLAAPKSTRRPLAPPRSGSSNYIAALAASPTVPEGFNISQAQTYSPITTSLAHREEQPGSHKSAIPDANSPYGGEQDMRRQRQKALLETVAGHGYDSTQDAVNK